MRGGSRNFGKGGPIRGRSPEPSAENFEKLDAISCYLAYIFGIRIHGLGYHSKLGLCGTKNSSVHDIETHRY